MQFEKCQFCANANPQCKNIFVDGIIQIESFKNFINYQCFKKNYFTKVGNDPIPAMKINYDCTGFKIKPEYCNETD